MRTRKPLLMTLALAVATLTATGQTVTPDGGSPIAAANLTTGALSTANTLTISGTWTAEHVKALRAAITGDATPSSGNNATLTTVTFDADAVMKSMEYLFRDCTALTGVTMPVKKNNDAVSFSCAFYGCKALKGTVNLSGFTAISSMENAIRSCSALEGVTMPTATNSTAISFLSAFSGCKALAGTVDLSGFTAISSIENAFSGCALLKGVTLPATNTPPADGISIYNAFSGCKALKGTVDLSGFTAISNMRTVFYGCAALEGVTMPATENSAAVNFIGAFKDCKALKTVDLSKFTAISSMSNVFQNCTALTSVKIPASSPASDFTSAFNGCTALAGTVDLSGFTKIWSMMDAFSGCKALTAVKLGSIPSDYITNAFLNANPNLLKYLPAGSTDPDNWTNCIVEGTSLSGITLTDGKPFHCPEAFDMGEGSAMSYTRTLTKDKWATLCLPFAAQVPADCVAKQLSGSTGASVSFGKVETLEANKPYIVAYTGNEPTQAVTFASATAAQIPATPAALETAATDYKMAGTYADLIEQSMYLLDNNNSFLLYNAGNLHPFRACITSANGQPNHAPRLSISHDDGGATGLDFTTLPAGASEVIPAVSRVYTLDGRLVKTVPAEEYATLKQGLERGIYVVNGKKMTVTE